MKSHGNTAQVKEQSRNRQIQVNEDDIGKLPEKEFRIMIIKMIQNFKTRIFLISVIAFSLFVYSLCLLGLC